MASVNKPYLGDNRLLFDRELINTLQQLNILSRKQTKYCRKSAHLNNITYASRNLITVRLILRRSFDVAYMHASAQ